MAEVDGLGSNSFSLASLLAASSTAARNQKTEKANEAANVKKNRFSDAIKNANKDQFLKMTGLPPEVQGMDIEEASIFLRDAVDTAGTALSHSLNNENLNNFKKAVSQFISFVVENNYEEYRKDHPVAAKLKRRQLPAQKPPVNVFGNYNTVPSNIPQQVRIEAINRKLDEIARDVLLRQSDNLKILSSINEVKGLVVDIYNG